MTDTPAAPALDIAQLRARQSFGLAIPAGIASALAGAGLWAAFTVFAKARYGLMAVAVGIIVGYSVRAAGKGIDQKFGILAAICALFAALPAMSSALRHFWQNGAIRA